MFILTLSFRAPPATEATIGSALSLYGYLSDVSSQQSVVVMKRQTYSIRLRSESVIVFAS